MKRQITQVENKHLEETQLIPSLPDDVWTYLLYFLNWETFFKVSTVSKILKNISVQTLIARNDPEAIYHQTRLIKFFRRSPKESFSIDAMRYKLENLWSNFKDVPIEHKIYWQHFFSQELNLPVPDDIQRLIKDAETVLANGNIPNTLMFSLIIHLELNPELLKAFSASAKWLWQSLKFAYNQLMQYVMVTKQNLEVSCLMLMAQHASEDKTTQIAKEISENLKYPPHINPQDDWSWEKRLTQSASLIFIYSPRFTPDHVSLFIDNLNSFLRNDKMREYFPDILIINTRIFTLLSKKIETEKLTDFSKQTFTLILEFYSRQPSQARFKDNGYDWLAFFLEKLDAPSLENTFCHFKKLFNQSVFKNSSSLIQSKIKLLASLFYHLLSPSYILKDDYFLSHVPDGPVDFQIEDPCKKVKIILTKIGIALEPEKFDYDTGLIEENWNFSNSLITSFNELVSLNQPDFISEECISFGRELLKEGSVFFKVDKTDPRNKNALFYLFQEIAAELTEDEVVKFKNKIMTNLHLDFGEKKHYTPKLILDLLLTINEFKNCLTYDDLTKITDAILITYYVGYGYGNAADDADNIIIYFSLMIKILSEEQQANFKRYVIDKTIESFDIYLNSKYMACFLFLFEIETNPEALKKRLFEKFVADVGYSHSLKSQYKIVNSLFSLVCNGYFNKIEVQHFIAKCILVKNCFEAPKTNYVEELKFMIAWYEEIDQEMKKRLNKQNSQEVKYDPRFLRAVQSNVQCEEMREANPEAGIKPSSNGTP